SYTALRSRSAATRPNPAPDPCSTDHFRTVSIRSPHALYLAATGACSAAMTAAGPGGSRVRRETGLQGGVLLSKPVVHHRRLIMTGSVTVLGLATALGLATPSAAGAQTHGHHNKVTVIADHLNNPRGLAAAPGGGLYLAEAGRGGNVCVA